MPISSLHTVQIKVKSCADPEGGRGVGGPDPHLENHKAIGFLINTGTDPMENYEATKPAFNVGPSSASSETSFKCRFADGPMVARFEWYLDSLSSHQLRKKTQKTLSKLDPL